MWYKIETNFNKHNTPLWIPGNHHSLPNIDSEFVFCAMTVRSNVLVLIPHDKTLKELAIFIVSTYGPSLSFPDVYGFRGIQTITKQVLTLWSNTRSAHICIYNLDRWQSLSICHYLFGITKLSKMNEDRIKVILESIEKVC